MSQPPQPPNPADAPYLSVIIPAYNEEERIGPTVRAVEDYLSGRRITWELIIVDDGSRDRTIAVAREAIRYQQNSRVVQNPRNMGKGATIRNGMLNHAKGYYRLFTDADNSTPIEEVSKLLRRLRRGHCDIAVGSRALSNSVLEKRQPFYREFMGRIFNLFVQIIVLPGIKDTQCGFKVFTAEAAEYVFKRQTLDGFSFDVEILALAHRAGFRIAEVPIRWINSPASRVSPLSDSAKMFLDLVRIRFRKV